MASSATQIVASVRNILETAQSAVSTEIEPKKVAAIVAQGNAESLMILALKFDDAQFVNYVARRFRMVLDAEGVTPEQAVTLLQRLLTSIAVTDLSARRYGDRNSAAFVKDPAHEGCDMLQVLFAALYY